MVNRSSSGAVERRNASVRHWAAAIDVGISMRVMSCVAFWYRMALLPGFFAENDMVKRGGMQQRKWKDENTNLLLQSLMIKAVTLFTD
jgi:hypothetical protein